MKRTTISLPDELAEYVEREAARRRVPVSELVREALTAHLGLEKPREIPWAGMFEGPDDGFSAANLDEFLATHWADDIARDSGLR